MQYKNLDELPIIVFEKIILITIIGALEGARTSVLSINEIEGLFFIPYTVSFLTEKGCSKDIIDLFQRACELEDIEDLISEKLEKNVLQLREDALILLSGYDEIIESPWTS